MARHVRLVHAHLAELMIMMIKDDCPVRLLEHLDLEVPEDIRYRLLQTLVVRVGKTPAGQGYLAAPLDDLRSLRLQDWIGVVADQLVEVARAIGQARLVAYGARPRYRRFKSQRWVGPNTGEIRDRCGRLRARRARNRSRHRQHQREIEVPPQPQPHARLPLCSARNSR